jgi:hypothetical protein
MAKTEARRFFTKNVNGEDVAMEAVSPADVVRYQFDGWREVTEQNPIVLSEPNNKGAKK